MPDLCGLQVICWCSSLDRFAKFLKKKMFLILVDKNFSVTLTWINKLTDIWSSLHYVMLPQVPATQLLLAIVMISTTSSPFSM